MIARQGYNEYTAGEIATITTSDAESDGFVNQATGANVDPAVVTLTITIDGTLYKTFTFGGEDGTITKDAVGKYRALVDTTPATTPISDQNWEYRWNGTAPGQALGKGFFMVTPG